MFMIALTSLHCISIRENEEEKTSMQGVAEKLLASVALLL